jgi:hypothetical protein
MFVTDLLPVHPLFVTFSAERSKKTKERIAVVPVYPLTGEAEKAG